MSHRSAKKLRKEVLLLMQHFPGIEPQRKYIRSWNGYSVMLLPTCARAQVQMSKRNVKRMRQGMEPVQPRKFIK